MSPFADKIRKLIIQYKLILKRYLLAEHYEQKKIELQIKRKDLKSAADTKLFQLANRVLHDIENWLANHHLPSSEYSGAQEFHQHFKNFLTEYRQEGDNVINYHQRASRAIVNAIQLLSQPIGSRTAEQLHQNISAMRQFGNRDQINQFISALQKKSTEHREFYSPFLHVLQSSI